MNFQLSSWVTLRKVMLMAMMLACSHIVAASALLSDDFNSGTSEPNPVWRFYDPFDATGSNDEGESKLTFSGENALISIPEGLPHDLWKPSSNNKAPRLLQPAPNTDFKFEVKFETPPKVKHQMQGIIVQENDNVFLRFDIFYNISGVELFIAYVDATSNASTTYASTALAKFPKYHRVMRSGNDWTFAYSEDGSTWLPENKVTFTQSLAVTEAGFFAGTGGVNPEFLSSVDYFIDLDEPITDNDSWTPPSSNASPPVISTWNGYAQPTVQFGQLGVSQTWANVLGNVSTNLNISTLSYKLNGGAEQFLNFGPDSKRLENKGDFNIEIDHNALNVGSNTVEIKAKDSNDQITSKVVTISYESGNTWPLPYTADWGLLSTIQEVESISHVVDGLWDLTADGIRTIESGYDRTIAIGDKTWSTDGYEVTVPFTPHSNFSGIGFAVGWQGHEGTRAPKLEWPVEALTWIRGGSIHFLEIITYGGPGVGEVEQASEQLSSPLSTNETYMLKSYSESLSAGVSRFYAKFWKQSEVEPNSWNIHADVPTRNGSVLLVAHEGDVTFGNISIKEASSSSDTEPPQISNIQVSGVTESTATISWDTNEPSNSVVDYGLDSNYGININDSAQVTSHSLTLTDLNANTVYHYQVKSADSNNNMASSEDLTFTTESSEDIKSPEISNIKAVVSDNSVTITWDTDESSTSRVDYGDDNTYGSEKSDSAEVTSHSLTLDGLTVGTYHYQVSSTDANGNKAQSLDLTFQISTTLTHLLPDNQWHQISLPLNPGVNNTVTDIFGDDELGVYGTQWVIYRYDSSANNYVKLALTDEMSQGVGYWIIQISGSDKILDMPAGSTPTITSSPAACLTEACFEIPLTTKTGTNQWNMIGYPFDARGHLNEAQIVTANSPCESGCTIDVAETNNITHNQLWTYNGSSYIIVDSSNDNLEPWTGFWIASLYNADGNSPSLLLSMP